MTDLYVSKEDYDDLAERFANLLREYQEIEHDWHAAITANQKTECRAHEAEARVVLLHQMLEFALQMIK